MNKFYGVGIDLVSKSRFEKILEQNYSYRLIQKMLNENEIIKFDDLEFNKKPQFLANRWSVKESLVKALNKKDINFKEIELNKTNTGKPYLIFHNSLKEYLTQNNINNINISISHEDDKTISIVIIN